MYKSGQKDGSKYVAEILSSLAEGARPTSTGLPRYGFSHLSGNSSSTNLTPSTLASIEQQFMELQSGSHDVAAAQSGFVPPTIRTGSSAEQSPASSQDQAYSDGEWVPPSEKRARHDCLDNQTSIYSMASQRKPRRKRDEQLSPEEEQRRLVRRERNKVAAAKCRQRRVDHTNRLINETEHLRDEQTNLEAEIVKLQQQKDQFEFVLQAHKQVCTAEQTTGMHEHNAVAAVTHQHNPAGLAHQTRQHSTIKTEYPDIYTTSSATMMPFNTTGQYETLISQAQHHTSTEITRPTSLSFASATNPSNNSSVSTAIGISITTPSSGFFNFSNMDGFVDGSTGLTPVNSNPCGREMAKRESTDSGSSDNGLASPSLITLR